MATGLVTFVTHASAKRQVQALVRKYNQATADTLGYKLEISFDKQESTGHITYTLMMKNINTNHWQVRRVTSSLLSNLQVDFTSMVTFMETNLAGHE